MRAVKLLVALSVFLVFAFAGYAKETGQETAPPAIPEMKQDVKTDAATQVPAATEEVKHEWIAPAVKEKRVVAAIGPDGVQQVEIIGGEYYFEPNHIVLKVNVPVELRVKEAKDASWFIPHDIVVKAPESGIDFKVSLKKEPQSIKFTPTKTGTYPLYCDKKPPFGKSHKDKGMAGVIEVVE
jgi:plastocyanin